MSVIGPVTSSRLTNIRNEIDSSDRHTGFFRLYTGATFTGMCRNLIDTNIRPASNPLILVLANNLSIPGNNNTVVGTIRARQELVLDSVGTERVGNRDLNYLRVSSSNISGFPSVSRFGTSVFAISGTNIEAFPYRVLASTTSIYMPQMQAGFLAAAGRYGNNNRDTLPSGGVNADQFQEWFPISSRDNFYVDKSIPPVQGEISIPQEPRPQTTLQTSRLRFTTEPASVNESAVGGTPRSGRVTRPKSINIYIYEFAGSKTDA